MSIASVTDGDSFERAAFPTGRISHKDRGASPASRHSPRSTTCRSTAPNSNLLPFHATSNNVPLNSCSICLISSSPRSPLSCRFSISTIARWTSNPVERKDQPSFRVVPFSFTRDHHPGRPSRFADGLRCSRM